MADQLNMEETNTFTINVPECNDEWGKTLINTLNTIFKGIVGVIHEDTEKISTQFQELKRDVLKKADEAAAVANDALILAKQNASAIDIINDKLIVIKHTNELLSEENAKLKSQASKLESYSRRNNLVIKGIAEDRQEVNCDNLVKKFLTENMNIDVALIEQMEFVRCHRLGNVNPGANRDTSPRPIIVRFTSYKDRQTVWMSRKNLSTTPQFSVSENFSNDVEYNRRKLYPVYRFAKQVETYRNVVSLRGDVLRVNSIDYTVNNLDDLPKAIHPSKLCYKSDENVHAFGGLFSDYSSFSNWKRAEFTYDGVSFSSSEQAYFHTMAMKSNDHNSALKILATNSPKEAKRLGGEITGFNKHSWNLIKGTVMKDVLRCKFGQNQAMKQELLNTGNKQIVESGRGSYFPCGLPLTHRFILDSRKYTSKNKLGEILQQLRTEFL